MNDFYHDPDSLAARLDALLPPGDDRLPDALDDDPLVEAAVRLAAAPRPALSPEAFARIQAKMQEALPVANPVPAPQPTPIRRATLRWPLLIAAAAAAMVLFVVVILLTGRGADEQIALMPTDTPTEAPATDTPATPVPTTEAASPVAPVIVTETNVMSTLTATLPTVTPVSPTATPVIPTVTPIPPVVTVPAPTRTPTPQPGNIIIEGQIESIEDNIVKLYSINLLLQPDNPLLKVLRVEDFVRVEGSFEVVGGVLVVEVVTLDLITETGTPVEVTTNPADPSQIWRDPGDCSNPPPPWAPARGWRARCEAGQAPGGGGRRPDDPPGGGRPENPGGGRGGGRGGGDDDDD